MARSAGSPPQDAMALAILMVVRRPRVKITAICNTRSMGHSQVRNEVTAPHGEIA